MILLIASAASVATARTATSLESARVQAVATTRIVKAVSASAQDWDVAAAHRREIRIHEQDGRTTLLRVIDHE
jgi:hypothetical protein